MSQNSPQKPSELIPEASRQLILVLAEEWHNYRAKLYLCHKEAEGWTVTCDYPAVCGKNGMAWGLGYYPAFPEEQQQPFKTEGDGKTPAGIFSLGPCMGYASQLDINPRLFYKTLNKTMQGIDDSKSRYYNQVVDCADLSAAERDWDSHEVMRRTDDRYKWLLVVNHNPANLPSYGSLIFMHLWKDNQTGTAGCTALAETSFLEILQWLDPKQGPVVVQLPQKVYQKFKYDWKLPLVN